MVVLKGKRIVYIITCLVMALAVVNIKGKEINENIVETSATPVSGHTIILDAGHGEPDRRCCF
jgi:N-acetylmuramoyl-L-alanine amidase